MDKAYSAYKTAQRATKRLERKAMRWREDGLTRAESNALWDQVTKLRYLETIAHDRYLAFLPQYNAFSAIVQNA